MPLVSTRSNCKCFVNSDDQALPRPSVGDLYLKGEWSNYQSCSLHLRLVGINYFMIFFLLPVLSALFIAIISVGCCCRCDGWWILHCRLLNAGHLRLFALHLQPLLTRVDECCRLTVIILGTVFTAITRSMTTMLPMRATRSSRAARHLTLVVGNAFAARPMTSSWTWIIRRLTLDRTWPLPMAAGRACAVVVVAWWSWSHRLRTRRDAKESALLTLGPAGTSCATGWVGRGVTMMAAFSAVVAVLVDCVVVVKGSRNTVSWAIQTVESAWCIEKIKSVLTNMRVVKKLFNKSILSAVADADNDGRLKFSRFSLPFNIQLMTPPPRGERELIKQPDEKLHMDEKNKTFTFDETRFLKQEGRNNAPSMVKKKLQNLT